MGKVFTITEGLENLGAMKTGGQGSVYKGRRIGEIITAIKLLPTPIYSESLEDKNYVDFQNEVQKLKKVNESPNPNVVKILSSGVSDTGNFPFIEMEYIEGPELEELLKPPHNPIFTIKEVLKVADQLSNALAHCHKVEVRHGDIKSNNVKFNIHTGNYVLLDFGLAVMSDEQRRSSLRHAGAIEFMAPEQNEGQMLFQTDVYSFGVILFELLSGDVPFPLQDKGETARNAVRLSHMETPAPDLLSLRRKALPDTWSAEKKEHEMHVPDWLLTMIYKCLEKKPEARFTDGIELYEYIIRNSTLAAKREEASIEQSRTLKEENDALVLEKTQLQHSLTSYKEEVTKRENELANLKATIANKDTEIRTLKSRPLTERTDYEPVQSGVSKSAFITLLIFTIAIAAVAAYSFLHNKNNNDQQYATGPAITDSSANSNPVKDNSGRLTNNKYENSTTTKTSPIATNAVIKEKPAEVKNQKPIRSLKSDTSREGTFKNSNVKTDDNADNDNGIDDTNNNSIGHFKVRSKAYFYNEPDSSTRRNAFINHWNNALLNALDYQDGFIYVIYKNVQGQVSKGWLRKKDLIAVD